MEHKPSKKPSEKHRMPSFADMIATMPTEELRKQIESMKEERETLYQEYDIKYAEWMKFENDELEIQCGSSNIKIKQLNRKIHMAIEERGVRDIQEMR